MVLLSPGLLIGTAQSFIGLGEEAGPKRGAVVELFLHGVGLPNESAWSAAFVHHAGFWSHFELRTNTSSWPLPPFGRCEDLALYARERRVLLADGPCSGDIYVQWSMARKQFVRAGIIVEVVGEGARANTEEPWLECLVVEGNSGKGGVADGPMVVALRRKISFARGDRVIRWTSLDPRIARGNPGVRTEVVAGRTKVTDGRAA